MPSLVLDASSLLVQDQREALEEYERRRVSEELSQSLEFPYCESLSCVVHDCITLQYHASTLHGTI